MVWFAWINANPHLMANLFKIHKYIEKKDCKWFDSLELMESPFNGQSLKNI